RWSGPTQALQVGRRGCDRADPAARVVGGVEVAAGYRYEVKLVRPAAWPPAPRMPPRLPPRKESRDRRNGSCARAGPRRPGGERPTAMERSAGKASRRTVPSPLASRPRAGADLHVHTTHSDGLCSPCEVVIAAACAGLAALAITDHDMVAALAIARPEATRLGGRVSPRTDSRQRLP